MGVDATPLNCPFSLRLLDLPFPAGDRDVELIGRQRSPADDAASEQRRKWMSTLM
jgi:hypothetical protein